MLRPYSLRDAQIDIAIERAREAAAQADEWVLTLCLFAVWLGACGVLGN